jgi:17beta-estradiol 17-dehydrogenase / 3beta-hydroxysteroid 3-dehydrogenase
MTAMERWRGRTALVTGASSGIGRSCAEALARAGLRVALCARRAERLDELAASLEAEGAEVLSIPADLRQEGSILAAFEAIRARWGEVDGQVVHVSSMSAHRVPTYGGVYSATKFAVRSLTEGLRKELRVAGSDIRVASISPGYVETEFARIFDGSEEAARATYARYPCIQPDEIADALLYLLGQPAHLEVHDILLRPVRQEH